MWLDTSSTRKCTPFLSKCGNNALCQQAHLWVTVTVFRVSLWCAKWDTCFHLLKRQNALNFVPRFFYGFPFVIFLNLNLLPTIPLLAFSLLISPTLTLLREKSENWSPGSLHTGLLIISSCSRRMQKPRQYDIIWDEYSLLLLWNRYLMAFECRATVAFQSNSPSRYLTASADTILCRGHYAQDLNRAKPPESICWNFLVGYVQITIKISDL